MSRDTLHPAMIEAATAALDAQGDRIAQYNGPGCNCGSVDGMAAWDRISVMIARADDKYPLPSRLYRLRSRPLEEHEELFAPCSECNRGGHVDEGYIAIGRKGVDRWLKEEERC